MNAVHRKKFINRIFTISSEHEFHEAAMELFRFQSRNNAIYQKYLELLGTDTGRINDIKEIPCLPVSFFKTHKIVTGGKETKIIFRSSGTGGDKPSHHYVHDPEIYSTSFLRCFKLFYGDPSGYCILALLPSYLERGDSSLVYMAEKLIKDSSHPESGFYLDDIDKLAETISTLDAAGENILLLGVSFALLDMVSKHSFSLKNTIIMETGGMKGRGKELTREELHSIITSRTGVKDIHSEYGMTELLSQAYSRSGGRFSCAPWMKVMIRDSYDPFTYVANGRNGGVNIIDLANTDSCAFLETADLGTILPGGEFEILGRFDNADIRGCNLLAG